jgi:predicted acetyltransferase
MNLKVQVEESRRIEETLKNQLKEKEKMKDRLEVEIVTLRKELQKKKMQHNNTKILDEIIIIQRPYYENSRLGYKQIHTENGSSPMTTKKEAEQRSYAEIIGGPINV